MQEQQLFTLSEIASRLIQKGAKCSCGYYFTERDIRCYPHPAGIPVAGYPEKQWVYFACPKCGYDIALWKVLNQIALQNDLERPFNKNSKKFLEELR